MKLVLSQKEVVLSSQDPDSVKMVLFGEEGRKRGIINNLLQGGRNVIGNFTSKCKIKFLVIK